MAGKEPPEDKVKAVKEILEKVLEDYAGDDNPSTALAFYIPSVANKICQLFKIKLPENPYTSNIMEYPDKIYNPNACVWFNEALQQVKEKLKEIGVEVE